MIDYCYITRFETITLTELNFINEIRKFKCVEVLVLNRNKIHNFFYTLTVESNLKIEYLLQKYFQVSRNYVIDNFVKVESNLNTKNFESLNTKYFIYFNDSGIEISDLKSITFYENKAGSLMNRIGKTSKNIDQNLLEINIYRHGSSKTVFQGKYEKDKLPLNNQFISIRRVLHHALSVTKFT